MREIWRVLTVIVAIAWVFLGAFVAYAAAASKGFDWVAAVVVAAGLLLMAAGGQQLLIQKGIK